MLKSYPAYSLFILIIIITGRLNICAQSTTFSVEKIAETEANAHARLLQMQKGTGASDNFNVHYYRCVWELDPAVRYIKGSVTVYFTVSENTSTIVFDLMSPLNTDSVVQRNNTLSFQHISNTVSIDLGRQLNAGTTDSLTIYYKGVPANTGFGSFIQSTHNGNIPVMWTLSEPYGARDWWPCKNGLDDKADSIDIYLIHPTQYKSASNGLLQSETSLANNKTITHWKHRYPIATYLICAAITDYTIFNRTVNLGGINLPMVTYCYPENLNNFTAGTQNVLDAMQLFHQTFGSYPFIQEKYGHVQFGWGGGMEHQTSTFIVSTDESLVAHELAHQWFGDKITCGSWQDIWLNEGFATYVARFYMENKYPSQALASRINTVANITSLPDGSVKVDDTLNVGRIFSGRLSYNKGSFLLNMLRLKLGDSVFFRGIRNYLQDPNLKYGYARNQDLQRNLEQASGEDLSHFFQQWYEGQGYPSYQATWSTIGSSHVKINLAQTTSHPSVRFFEMKVPLRFIKGNLEKTVYADNRFNRQDFVFPIGFIPDTVLIDPESQLISKNNTTQKIATSNSGNAGILVYPNPARQPFHIYLHDFPSNDAGVSIFSIHGQLVWQQRITLLNGSEIINPDIERWPAGTYVIRVNTAEGKEWSTRFIK